MYTSSVVSWELYNRNLETSLKFAIPSNWMREYLKESEALDEPLYLKVTPINSDTLSDRHFHSMIFSGVDTTNEKNLCIIPSWALNKLQMTEFSEIMVEKIYDLEKITYLRVKSLTKHYAEWDDLKDILENYLSTMYCINTGDLLKIGGIEFYVTRLMDHNHNELKHGSLFETDVKIDFEVPIDIECEEHLAQLEILALKQSKADEEERIQKSRPSRSQIADMFEKKIKNI